MLLVPIAFEDATFLDRGDRVRMTRSRLTDHRVRRMLSRQSEAA